MGIQSKEIYLETPGLFFDTDLLSQWFRLPLIVVF